MAHYLPSTIRTTTGLRSLWNDKDPIPMAVVLLLIECWETSTVEGNFINEKKREISSTAYVLISAGL